MDPVPLLAVGLVEFYSVDGEDVRSNRDPDFTDWASHYHFDFIPEGQVWLDDAIVQKSPSEIRFNVTRALAYLKARERGLEHDDACDFARQIEKGERGKADARSNEAFAKDLGIRKEKLGEIDGIAIFLVDGEAVRNDVFIDFVLGGHDLVYPFIPKEEIWIDDVQDKDGQEYTLEHELYERQLMFGGMSYDDAHDKALGLEWKERQEDESAEEHVARVLRQIIAQINEERKKSPFFVGGYGAWITERGELLQVSNSTGHERTAERYFAKNHIPLEHIPGGDLTDQIYETAYHRGWIRLLWGLIAQAMELYIDAEKAVSRAISTLEGVIMVTQPKELVVNNLGHIEVDYRDERGLDEAIAQTRKYLRR